MNLLFFNLVSGTFADKVVSISNKLGIDPDWLMFLMDWESGLDSSITNAYGCTGLIQFCADYSGGTIKTIDGVPYSLESIKKMAPEAQLDVVYAYLKEIQDSKGKFEDFYQLYFAILFPEASDKPDDYVLKTQSNPVFDLNKNGTITVAEVKQYLDARVKAKVPSNYWNTFFKKKTFCSSIKEKSYSGASSLCLQS